MSSLSAKHIESILSISNIAQEAACENHFPVTMFKSMSQLFESDSAVFYSMGDDLNQQSLWDGFGYRVSHDSVWQYENHYRTLDPCYQGLKQRVENQSPMIVSTDQVISSNRSYINSEYYQDFLRPQNIHNSIIFGVGDQQGVLGLFGFHRSKDRGIYDHQDHLKARLFASQIAASLRLRQLNNNWLRLRAVSRKLMAHASVQHYLVLDDNFNLVDSVGDASSKLGIDSKQRLYTGESQPGVKHLLPVDVRRYLSELFQGVALDSSNTAKVFDNLHGNCRIRVDLLELGHSPSLALLVFLDEDSNMISQSRLQAFALTPREQDIARCVCRGLTTGQMAAELGISPKTTEHHLTHIYRKTQVRNRTELLRQLSH